ncbi:hypothetical protein PCE1_001864 [Barthelona sp. PCE]
MDPQHTPKMRKAPFRSGIILSPPFDDLGREQNVQIPSPQVPSFLRPVKKVRSIDKLLAHQQHDWTDSSISVCHSSAQASIDPVESKCATVSVPSQGVIVQDMLEHNNVWGCIENLTEFVLQYLLTDSVNLLNSIEEREAMNFDLSSIESALEDLLNTESALTRQFLSPTTIPSLVSPKKLRKHRLRNQLSSRELERIVMRRDRYVDHRNMLADEFDVRIMVNLSTLTEYVMTQCFDEVVNEMNETVDVVVDRLVSQEMGL